MIAYRLADSLPQNVFKSLGAPQPSADGEDRDAQKRKNIEDALDKGYGSCILENSRVAKSVVENWRFYDGKRYDLIAYVVMPNHVYILIKTYESWSIGKIVWAWKSLITKFVNSETNLKEKFSNSLNEFKNNTLSTNSEKMSKFVKMPEVEKKFTIWQREYWDRFIRDENHFGKAVEYIHQNPVKAGLVS